MKNTCSRLLLRPSARYVDAVPGFVGTSGGRDMAIRLPVLAGKDEWADQRLSENRLALLICFGNERRWGDAHGRYRRSGGIRRATGDGTLAVSFNPQPEVQAGTAARGSTPLHGCACGYALRRTAEENVPVRHVGRPFRAVATARKGRPTGKLFPAARLNESRPTVCRMNKREHHAGRDDMENGRFEVTSDRSLEQGGRAIALPLAEA